MDWTNILFATALVGMIAMGALSLYSGVRKSDVHLQLTGWGLLAFAALPVFFLLWRWWR